jgi:hypothetical protein
MTRRRFDGTDPDDLARSADRVRTAMARLRARREAELRALDRARGIDPGAPVLPEVVLGFRDWTATAYGTLGSRAWGTEWRPGINDATCRRGMFARTPAHAAPGTVCDCGLYAYHRYQPDDHWYAMQYPGAVVVRGAVAGWGRMIVHADGWRAEHAMVLALAYHETADPRQAALVRDVLAPRYRVPAVPMDLLEREASLYASPVPERLVPDPAPLAQETDLVFRTNSAVSYASTGVVTFSSNTDTWSST